jgi:hypothetical protein
MRYQTVAAGETTVAAKGRGTTKNKREKAMTSYNEDSELQWVGGTRKMKTTRVEKSGIQKKVNGSDTERSF